MHTVITGIARTPIGRFGGAFQPLQAVDLGAAAIGAALERSGLEPTRVDEVLFGHVIQAGTGQITSRQAAVRAGIPMTVPTTTINKVCLSGMAAIAMADRDIRIGDATIVMAGGMESMTNAPYLIPSARYGARMGDAAMVDSMTHDGLWCAFDHCTMGESSDSKNAGLGIGRAEQDEWSAESHRRAAAATDRGGYDGEIVPVAVPQRKGAPVMVSVDEGIRRETTMDSLGALRPAFHGDGTITAGNASQISDGARRSSWRVAKPPKRPACRSWPRSSATARSAVPTPPCTNGPPRRCGWRSSGRAWPPPISTWWKSMRRSPQLHCGRPVCSTFPTTE